MKLLTSIDLQSNKITNLASGSASTDGANIGNITSALSGYAQLSGATFTGSVTANGVASIGGVYGKNPNASENNSVLDILNEANSNGNLDLFNATTYYNGAGLSNFHIRHARGTSTSPLPVQTGDYLMSMGFRGYKNTGFSGSTVAMQAIATTSYTDGGNTGADLYVQVTANNKNVDINGRSYQYVFRNDGCLIAPSMYIGDSTLVQPNVTTLPTSDTLQVSGTAYVSNSLKAGNLITPGSLNAGNGSGSSANHLITSVNVSGTPSSKYELLAVGVTNQVSFFGESFGFPGIGFNLDVSAGSNNYVAHEAGFSGLIYFNKGTGAYNFSGTASTAAVSANIGGSMPVLLSLDNSGNAIFNGSVTATTQSTGDSSKFLATTAFVQNSITANNTSPLKAYRQIASQSNTTIGYSVVLADEVIAVNPSLGPVTITLLSAVGCKGKPFTVKTVLGSGHAYSITVYITQDQSGYMYMESPSGAAVQSYVLTSPGTIGSTMTWLSNGSNYELIYMR